jgi:hypothetical protein
VGVLYLLQRPVFVEMLACLRVFRQPAVTELTPQE